MKWDLIKYDTFPGKYNMDFDLALVRNSEIKNPILRFYGWEPYCISIGANQSYTEINRDLASSNNIDVVKRPTGGRAILHAEELTYSVIMPNSAQVSGKDLYKKISQALVHGLNSFHYKLNNVELENTSPNFTQLLKDSAGAICFASTAKSEVKFEGKKLVGSAQRKLGRTILQHGSILIGVKHQELVDYLNVEESEILALKEEIRNKTIEISSIINEPVDIIKLQDKIIDGFAEIFKASFYVNELETYSY